MLGNTAFAAAPISDNAQGSFISRAISEAVGADSSLATQMTFVGSISESVSTTDSQTKTLTLYTNISEQVATTATPSALLVMGMQVNEATAFVDTPRSQADYVANVDESLTGFDFSLGLLDITVAISEAAALADENTQRLLWELVDDQQNPNWTDIE